MSAIAVEYPLSAPGKTSDVTPLRPGTPRLRLVPGGYDDSPAGPASTSRAPGSGRLRLTRRGRLARTLSVVALAALAIFVVYARYSGATDVTIDHATTVQEGETLSEIALEQLPTVPLRESVPALQRVNKMTTTSVSAGQTVMIPSM